MRVCIMGTGRMGRRHIDAGRELGFEIVGIHDLSAEAMQIAVKDHGIDAKRCFTNAKEMLEALRPDGVVVASTAPGHAGAVLDAVKAGAKFILCEKPMAVSLSQCEQMLEACRTNQVVLGINHQMRFMEQYTQVKRLASSEEFGGLESINVVAGNFGLAMNGCHYFEMFRYLTDEELMDVQFWADKELVPNPRGVQFQDYSGQLRATSKSGKRLVMELGGKLGHGVQVVYGCRFGQIIVDELSGDLRAIHRQEEFRSLPTTRYGMPAETLQLKISPADVLGPTKSVWTAMLKGENYPNGECGQHALKVLVAANVSAEQSNRCVHLDTEVLPKERVFKWA